MKSALVPLAQGCEELEAVTIIDILRRADISVVTASLDDNLHITASRGVRLVADQSLADTPVNDFDMIVLPGGQPGTRHLLADTRLKQSLLDYGRQDRWLAAICAAPSVLATHGLLDNYQATAFPGTLTADAFPLVQISSDAVVIDRKRITSRGPGTAIAFALTLVEVLTDSNRRQQVAAGLSA
ncbi:hypothetical protein Q7C_2005 [Methylophaga frappieri]|uniref:DJ-1/PfpI domain-containing protein n=1 Tax=Methylophaga frappieri (strain ATCC BAA-2434 / DSM 25690 / JAM7) TaxID=754477 RepID=I1YJQ2_METFJ|nr:DJ-1 family glyoxalase III [Methylophaga frappieri]AFJ03145.1 hypothetical protein Q7C_2005 [Methylophaga frappieri]